MFYNHDSDLFVLVRRRVEYELMNDPHSYIGEANLRSLIQDIRRDTPFAGISLLYGSLRSRGIKVTREQIRSSLRSVDPLGAALRAPADLTARRPYSACVPGPNSLWHIGNSSIILYNRL